MKFRKFFCIFLVLFCLQFIPFIPPFEPIPLESPDIPEELASKITETIYPYSDFVVGYVPWDLHGHLFRFQENTPWNEMNFEKTAEYMARHGVNFTRMFAYCLEDKWTFQNLLHPLPVKQGKFQFEYDSSGNLKLNLEYVQKMKRRLSVFHDRKINIMICLASGIKQARIGWTLWGRNNIHEIISYHDFFSGAFIESLFMDYVQAMVKEFDSPHIYWELINEPQDVNIQLLDMWVKAMMIFLTEDLGLPQRRIVIEMTDSSIVLSWLKRWKKFLFSYHGINTAYAFERFHTPGTEMQQFFYASYGRRIVADSDGAITWDARLIGKGLRGYSWNPNFSRPASLHMKQGLINNYKKGGGGWIIMSAAAWARKTEYPDMDFWFHSALDGITEKEAKEFNVDYRLNKLGELKAIRQAVKGILKTS